MQEVLEILKRAAELGATDVLLVSGSPPMGRVHGELRPLGEVLSSGDAARVVRSLMTDRQTARFEEERELDLALTIPGVGRFRVNAYFRAGVPAAVLRRIPTRPMTLKEIGLEEELAPHLVRSAGLILVAGPAGSGKTTLLNAAVDWILRHRSVHVITIEDPIEYLHEGGRGTVSQREVGSDTRSFASALRSALRQSPDVIVIGEVRDRETAESLMVAAQTGHLVLASLHAFTAPEAVEKLLNLAQDQAKARMELAEVLLLVVVLQLLPGKGGGRILAHELLLATPAVRTLIREGKPHQMRNLMSTTPGMRTMERSLADLLSRGLITLDEATARASNKQELLWHVHGVRPG